MSHSTTLDNGVVFICNSDLSGKVTMVLPDHRTLTTDWNTLAAAETLKTAVQECIEKYQHDSRFESLQYCFSDLRDALRVAKGIQ